MTTNFPGMVQSFWRAKQVLWAQTLLPHSISMVAVSRAEHAYQSVASCYTSWLLWNLFCSCPKGQIKKNFDSNK